MIGLHRIIAAAALRLEIIAFKRLNGLLFPPFSCHIYSTMIVCVIDVARRLRRIST